MKIKTLLLLSLFLFGTQKSYANDSINLNSIKTNPLAAIAIAIPAFGFVAYQAYKKVKSYIYNQKVDFIANNILTGLRTTLFNKNNEKIMREKAQLNNRLKRILEKVDNALPNLDQESYDLKKYERIKRIIHLMEKRRHSKFGTPNPYDDEYVKPTVMDNLIDDEMAKSFIFSLKHEDKYSPEDKLLKEKQKPFNDDVFKKLEEKTANKPRLFFIKLILKAIKGKELLLNLFIHKQ